MSGRKRSEVVDLLSTSENIRKEILSNSYKNINSILKKNSEVISQIEKGLDALRENLPKVPENIKKSYEKDIKIIEKSLDTINKWRASVLIESFKSIEKDLKEVDNNFNEMDKQANLLRKSISSKDWYCDSEYNEAQKLIKNYKIWKEKIISISEESSKKNAHNNEILEQTKYQLENSQKLKRQIESLKERLKADNHKTQLSKEFEYINIELANKFMKKEYTNLKENLNILLNESIQTINNSSESMYNKIIEFTNHLNLQVEKFNLKKEKALREFQELKDFTHLFEFKDIEAILDEKDEYIDIFTFQDRYCKESLENEYKTSLEFINESIKSENFQEAFNLIKNIREKVVEASKNCTNTYERLLKEQDMAAKIISATYELGYDLNVKYLDDDIRNGFSIEAILGDEIINFDRVCIDEDGQPIIDIDHEEGVSGTCGNTMKNLMKSLQNEGIFITDITKNGRSVIYKKKESNTWETQNKTETLN